jgi:hypothetical protein
MMARDLDTGIVKPTQVIVDEQTKAAAKRAAAKGPTPDEALLANVQAQIAKLNKQVAAAESTTPKAETAAERLARIKNERVTGGGTEPPSEAPAGTHWSFIGGQWKLYKDAASSDAAGADTIVSSVDNGDGTTTTTWKSGKKETNVTYNKGGASTNAATAAANLVAAQNQAALDASNLRDRQSAYDLLYNEFNKYGLGSLVEGIKGMIQSNISPSQFSIELQNTDAYKKRFAANQDRIKAGLKALSPAEYIGLEDQYQNIMRNYGLPASYYSKDSMGTQVGFEKFLANDVSASELEDRISTAQQRVLNSNPEVLQALKQFYPDISNADILSYALDPSQALTNIKRKVTAAEIGGAALAAGLQASGGTAESLAGLGITKAQAQQGYTDIAGILPRGSQLADIYGQQPYNQQTAEAEVFNTAGAASAAARRKKLTSLETAQFSGSSGVGALGRDKALYGAMQGQQGQY